MNQNSNPKLTSNAKTLRKSMTKEERRLWYDFFKGQPFTVNRQKVIGTYIVDFYCAEAGLVVELDGSQHYEANGRQSDELRDAFLRSCGLQVLRYSNYDVNCNFEGVCTDILEHLNAAKSNPPRGQKPSP